MHYTPCCLMYSMHNTSKLASFILPSLPCLPAPPSCPSALPIFPAPPSYPMHLPLSPASPSFPFPPARPTCPSLLPLPIAPPPCPPHSQRPICDQSGAQPDSKEANERTPSGGSRIGIRFTAQEEGIRGVYVGAVWCGVGAV